ncbi:hypothetical protein HDV05_006436 [Chytridiales sp. JEL 0842]|nr:hypothetical protein HDV05_006436 [Chytridiales sp. JEL 0842]
MSKLVQRLSFVLLAGVALLFLAGSFFPQQKERVKNMAQTAFSKSSSVKPAISKSIIHVEGFGTCPYFQNSRDVANHLYENHADLFLEPAIKAHSRAEWNTHKEVLAKVILQTACSVQPN